MKCHLSFVPLDWWPLNLANPRANVRDKTVFWFRQMDLCFTILRFLFCAVLKNLSRFWTHFRPWEKYFHTCHSRRISSNSQEGLFITHLRPAAKTPFSFCPTPLCSSFVQYPNWSRSYQARIFVVCLQFHKRRRRRRRLESKSNVFHQISSEWYDDDGFVLWFYLITCFDGASSGTGAVRFLLWTNCHHFTILNALSQPAVSTSTDGDCPADASFSELLFRGVPLNGMIYELRFVERRSVFIRCLIVRPISCSRLTGDCTWFLSSVFDGRPWRIRSIYELLEVNFPVDCFFQFGFGEPAL